jgi:hypothetical protein
MSTLQEYRSSLSQESGPYIGPESYDLRAMHGSDVTKLVVLSYPIQSGIPQQDTLVDRPLYRPNAVELTDRNRYVMTYDPSTGTVTPDLPWTNSPYADTLGTTYGFLEALTYHDMEQYDYIELEGSTPVGPGERFEILGPWDAPTAHRLINEGLRHCWIVVEVVCVPVVNSIRHDLSQVCPWLIDPGNVLQVGLLANGEDINLTDP